MSKTFLGEGVNIPFSECALNSWVIASKVVLSMGVSFVGLWTTGSASFSSSSISIFSTISGSETSWISSRGFNKSSIRVSNIPSRDGTRYDGRSKGLATAFLEEKVEVEDVVATMGVSTKDDMPNTSENLV